MTGGVVNPSDRMGAPVDSTFGAAPVEARRVYVWDAVVRVTHWVIALTIVLLTVTGIYIGNPYLIASGEAGENFVMGTMRVVHMYAGVVFSGAVLARILWMFVGSRWARWTQLVPTTPARLKNAWDAFKFYSFMSKEPAAAVGHNAMAGMSYVAIFIVYTVVTLTGLGLYAISAPVDSYARAWTVFNDWFGGPQTSRLIHHICMWIIVVFTCAHVWLAFMVSRFEQNGTMESIFSGYKFIPTWILRELDAQEDAADRKKERRDS